MQRDYRSTHHCRDTVVFSICFRPQVNKINPDVENKHPSSFQVLGLIGVTAKKSLSKLMDIQTAHLLSAKQVQNGISSNSFFRTRRRTAHHFINKREQIVRGRGERVEKLSARQPRKTYTSPDYLQEETACDRE